MGSNRDVSIGVKVEGAGKAKGELRGVAEAARAAGSAGGAGQTVSQGVTKADHNQARAKSKVAKATGKAAKAQDMFNDSARTAMTGILGQFSPALAAVATIAVDVAKGIGGISKALLGVLGVGAAIGGLVMLFQHLADAARKAEEAIKRLEEARKKQRDESLGAEGQVTEALAKAGVQPDAKTRQRVVSGMRDMAMRTDGSAIPAEYARSGLIAQILGGLSDEERAQFIAGAVAAGEGPVEFGRDQAANKAAIAGHLRAGGKDGAAEFAREYFSGLRQATRRGATSVGAWATSERERLQQRVDTEIDVLGRWNPALTEEQLNAMRLQLREEAGVPVSPKDHKQWREVRDDFGNTPAWQYAVGKAKAALTVYQRESGEATRSGVPQGGSVPWGDNWSTPRNDFGAPGGSDQQPVIIHHHHNNTTNIDTHYGALPGHDENRGVMSADLVGGTGVWN